MKELLKQEPSLVNLGDSKKLTPLHHAVLYYLFYLAHKILNPYPFY